MGGAVRPQRPHWLIGCRTPEEANRLPPVYNSDYAMTIEEAVARLQELYEASRPTKELSLAPLLFGIRHADELAGFTHATLRRVAQQATGHANYATEIHQGRRLARYVQWRPQS